MIEGGPVWCPSPDGRSSLETSTICSGDVVSITLFELAIAELTRRQLMAAVENTAKTGKRGASKEPRKHDTFLGWYLERRLP